MSIMRVPFVGTLLAVGLLALSQSNASCVTPGISLDFNSLPSAQGWDYEDRGSGIPETDVFSVDGTTLEQDTMGESYSAILLYSLAGVVNPEQPYSLAVTARVLEHSTSRSWPFGFGFAVDSGSERITIGMSTSQIAMFISDGEIPTVSSDTTQFHDYRLEGTPGVGWEFFVDNISIDSGPFGSSHGNTVLFGDLTAVSSARAEITSFTFTQVPEPTAFTLVGLGSLALVLVRRSR